MGQRLRITLLFLLVCMCSASLQGFTFTCKEAERNALLQFKHSFIHKSDSLGPLGWWVGEDCCSWMGIGCDNVTGNVIKLDLGSDVYESYHLEAGEVNPALLELKYLTYLNLSGVDFNGTRIPEFFGSMRQLQHLDLSAAHFSGRIPPHLGNLSDLVILDLSIFPLIPDLFTREDALEIEANNLEWAFGLEKLQYLDLSGINLTQARQSLSLLHRLPSLSVLNLAHCGLGNSHTITTRNSTISCSNLQHLDLSFNLFSGPIPDFLQNLSSIRFLDLSSNSFSSSIPPFFERLSSLEVLSLSYNNLSVVSPGIGSLSSLQTLDLSNNNLETLPPSLGRLSSLSFLDLSYNNLSVVHQASLANLSSLSHLDLSSNSLILDLSPDWIPPFQLDSLYILPCKLNSSFPNWVLSQKKIWYLDLSDTGILGPIPDNISIAMPSLSSLILASNHINGSIPRSLCRIAQLFYLHLENNRLSGKIPDCWANSQIMGMDLSSNKLSGPIPNSLYSSDLFLLSLNNNSIEGELPSSRNISSGLELLDVSMNKLHGEIPPWDGANFLLLEILILRENKFEGRIPPQLCSVQTLRIINLANNDLVGTIPQCFGSFKSMGFMLQSNVSIAQPPLPISDLRAQEVVKGQDREYTTILDKLVNIDLSCNHLVGVIPAEIANLSLLDNLNLSHNHLMGNMPMEIGRMKSLESLDLSSNNLSGSIPESIISLDFLSNLNLSFNNLHGPIPTGRHLETLDDPSIYMGNPGLCGVPLIGQCSKGDSGAHPPTSTVLEVEEDNKREKMWFYMVIMLGFATGFWGVIGILVVHKRWRHAYFRIAEELAD